MKNNKNQDLKIEEDKIDEVYKPKKLKNIKLSGFIQKYISEVNLEIIMNCSTFMEFITDETKKKSKQFAGNSCKNRFCPLCSYRKARKDGLKILAIMKAIESMEKKKFIFLTLTYKRVSANDLEDTIKHLNKSFKKLFERKEVEHMNLGHIKKLEVTYDKNKTITKDMYRGNPTKNMKSRKKYYDKLGLQVGDYNPTYDTYHVHFHVILCVDKSYFDNAKIYLSRDKFLSLWQQSTDDFNITQLDVRKIESVENTNKVNELAKYSAKDSDYLYSENVFNVFYKALRGKRLLTFAKIFKDYAKKYENGELEEFKEKDKTKYIYFLKTFWLKNEYEKIYTLINKLDDSESERIKSFIDIKNDSATL